MFTQSTSQFSEATTAALAFLVEGGPSIWAIGGVSVVGLTVVLWKVWRLVFLGAWKRAKVASALEALDRGRVDEALAITQGRRGLRNTFLRMAISARISLPQADAEAEVSRVAKDQLNAASAGLRVLELIATMAPLLGLLGTVLGMIAAFQALQESGSRADPALLAGGIWEALLTTAAGMAVAIPASVALTWFESVVDHIRHDLEDIAARVFVARAKADAMT